ncbi:MAG TPA: sigma-70 family RNA polymerase sigma factor [Acidimicrobiales bacterium]|nr:sigma-70 family RNA polymerase sigma factor [Acidimicrobiales bacterium]
MGRAFITQDPEGGYPDWESVYRDNVGRVYALMFSRVGNRPDAEDLTAEVFRAALSPLNLSASGPEVRAYLLVTARTVLARYWQQRFSIEVTIIDVDAEIPQYETLEDSRAPARVAEVLARLPDRHRRVLELRFLELLSLRDTARHMGISVGNVKVLQHRALRLAAQEMEENPQ